jgi:hypothetical protein
MTLEVCAHAIAGDIATMTKPLEVPSNVALVHLPGAPWIKLSISWSPISGLPFSGDDVIVSGAQRELWAQQDSSAQTISGPGSLSRFSIWSMVL